MKSTTATTKKSAKVVSKKSATPARTKAAAKSALKRPAQRADLGAPIDGFFARQPPELRKILEALRKLVESTVPEAESSIKWGMPFYTLGGKMMIALGGHRSHVNLVLAGPPDAFDDPEGRLEGSAKGGRHLKLTSLAQLPTQAVRGWIKAAAAQARAIR